MTSQLTTFAWAAADHSHPQFFSLAYWRQAPVTYMYSFHTSA